jgi:hypothetical protein
VTLGSLRVKGVDIYALLGDLEFPHEAELAEPEALADLAGSMGLPSSNRWIMRKVFSAAASIVFCYEWIPWLVFCNSGWASLCGCVAPAGAC